MSLKRHLLSVLTMSLTVGQSLWALSDGASAALKDAYPDRSLMMQLTQNLCGEAQKSAAISGEELSRQLQAGLHQNFKLRKLTTDASGWTADFVLPSGEILKLMKIGTDFSLNLRQTESTIEAIAGISLESNCQKLSEARFTYYNAARRPVRRLKLNSQMQVVQSVVIEEPPLEAASKETANTIRIGVIDSGIDYNHPALIEKSRPLLGIDLTNPERPPYDYTNTVQNELMGRSFSHGTAVADIASRNVDSLIVPVRIENQSKLSGKAVEYLAQKKVRIVNISQGTSQKEDWLEFKDAVTRHPEILFIVSAGNDSKDLSQEAAYPCAFEIPNMLVVASVNSDGQLSSFSNFSSKFVHVAAVGEDVKAALAGGGMRTVHGTSFSSPLVANIAARLLQKDPALTAQQLRKLLIEKAKPSPQLTGKVQYGILSLD